MFRIVLAISLIFLFLTSEQCFSSSISQVGLYGMWERQFHNDKAYINPFNFKEIELTSQFTSPSGRKVNFVGFFDGDGQGGQFGQIWKLRFMPDELGKWSYIATFSDGTPGGTGEFECIPSDLHGPIRPSKENPYWFEHADGTPFFMNGMKYIFLERLDSKERSRVIQVLSEQNNFNAIMGVHGKISDSEGGNFDRSISDPFWIDSRSDYGRNKFEKYSLKYWTRLDQVLQELGNAGMILIPFGIVGGTNGGPPLPPTTELRLQFARYWSARWSAYWNATFQPQSEYEENYVLKNGGVEEICEMLSNTDPWDHLISVHSLNVATEFSDKSWFKYFTVQSVNPNNHDNGFEYNNQSCKLHKLSSKPVLFHECIWEGSGYNSEMGDSPDVIRRSAWQMVMGGGGYCYSDEIMPHHWSRFTHKVMMEPLGRSYEYLNILYEFITSVRFFDMRPRNDLVKGKEGITCLAKENEEYVIFFHRGGEAKLNRTSLPGEYSSYWLNPRNGQKTPAESVLEGAYEVFRSPNGGDWVLHIYDSESA